MGAKKAVRYLTVGETTYAPGDEVPADVVELVDNPEAWVNPDAEADEDDEADEKPAKKAAAKRSGN